MHIKKRNIINLFLAFIVSFSFVGAIAPDVERVQAASNITVVQDSMSVAQFNNPNNIDVTFLRQLDDAIYLNSSVINAEVTKSNSFWVLAEDTGTYYLQVCLLAPRVECGTYTLPRRYSSLVSFNTISFISSYNFTFTNMTTSSHVGTNQTTTNRFYLDGRDYVIGSYNWIGSANGGVTLSNFTARYTDVVCVRDYTFPFDPILTPVLDYPYNLNIQTQGFTEWLINTGKYREIGASMLANHVGGFVELFNEYGASLTFFKKQVSAFFDYHNIGQGVSDYNVILNKTRQLYQEYLRLKNDTVGNHLLPRVASTIEPDTNDTNQTLITNTIDDTEIVSILRDILRTLLSFPATWYDMHQQLMIKLDELDLTTNIVDDGGTNDLDLLFTYDQDEFESDWNSFEDAINDDVASKTALIDSISNRSIMPENMLSDQTTFSLTVPLIDGYTVQQNGSGYTTNIHNYTFDMSEHATFDAVFKKIKRFIGVIMIIAYLVSLRYRIPRIVRGES